MKKFIFHGARMITLSQKTGSYCTSKIVFQQNDQGPGLFVTIETERLFMRSILNPIDCQNAADLLGDQRVMQKYANGDTKTRQKVEERIKYVWAKSWDNNDPYSWFSVFKNDSKKFLGLVILAHTQIPGQAELGGLAHSEFWNNGYASEAVKAIVCEYAPLTKEKGYTLDGQPLNKIVATARHDNVGSVKLLESLGMKLDFVGEKHGALRKHYSCLLSEILVTNVQKLQRSRL